MLVEPAHGSNSCVVEARESLAVILRHTPALAPVQENSQDNCDENQTLHFLVNSLVGGSIWSSQCVNKSLTPVVGRVIFVSPTRID